MTVPYSRRMQGYGSDFIKEMFAAARNPDLISFAGGAPAPARATRHRASRRRWIA